MGVSVPATAGSTGVSGGNGGAAPPRVLTTIAVAPGTFSIVQGGTVQYGALGTYSDGSTESLTAAAAWNASGGGATVTAGGLLTAGVPGQVTITASSGQIAGTASLTVSAPLPVLSAIAVLPATSSVIVGARVQYAAMGTYSDGSTDALTGQVQWSASGGAASISAGGLLTAETPEQATVTGSSGQIAGRASLTVNAPVPVLSSIAVLPPTSSAVVGASVPYAAIGTYSDGSTKGLTREVRWSASGAGATITAGGLLAVTEAGAVTVIASSGRVMGTAQMTVAAPAPVLTGLTVTPATASVAAGNTVQYTASGTYSDGSTALLTSAAGWSTSAATSTITAAGLLTSGGAGEITVTAAVGSVSGTALLQVTPHHAVPGSFTTAVAPVAGEDLAGACTYQMDLLDTTLPISGVWVIFERGDSLALWQDADLRALAGSLGLGLVYAHQCNAASYPDLLSDGSKGPARALRSALDAFASLSGHGEIAQANLVLFGFSAAGVLSITSAETMPGRVLTVITYAAGSAPLELRQLTPSANFDAVPMLMLANAEDAAAGDSMSRVYFATGRRAGAPWAFAVQPDVTHCCSFTAKPILLAWVGAVVPLRQTTAGGVAPVSPGLGLPGTYACTPDGITDGRGYTDCIFTAASYPAPAAADVPGSPTVWLPDAAVGQAWLSWVGFGLP